MTNLTRRQFIAGASAGAASAANADAGPPEPEPAIMRGVRFREFLVTIRDEEGDRVKGYGLTLEDVIARETDIYRSGRAYDSRPDLLHRVTVEQYSDGYPDQVVWEHDRVVAVLQSRADGSMKAIRIDR